MLGQPSSTPGFEVPLHRALTEPILIAGAPRSFAILNGTLSAAIGLGLQALARRPPDLARRPRRRRLGHSQGSSLPDRTLPPCPPQRSAHMLNLQEYQSSNTSLCDYLPWACLVAPGIVLNKDGSFQRTIRYRGPDLDSATEAELVSVTARINNVLKRFGAGWALFFEAERRPALAYPGARFADAASWLVDQERHSAFTTDGEHHESRYYLTLLYLPPPEHQGRAERMLYERTEGGEIEADAFAQLAWFETESERALELLAAILPEAQALSDAETLTYLHGTISTGSIPSRCRRCQPISMPCSATPPFSAASSRSSATASSNV